MITTKIIGDSINPLGVRLVTALLKYPRFIHSEFMTHRVVSKNAASSRAIKFERMLSLIRDQPAYPERWPYEQPGMVGGNQLTEVFLKQAQNAVVWLRQRAIDTVMELDSLLLHKSVINRYLEPWAHITVIASGTDKGWRNFFALRAHTGAMPEFQVLAYRFLHQYLTHQPSQLDWGEWHIPFFEGQKPFIRIANSIDLTFVQIATARCARLSYLTHDGVHDPLKDIQLHDRLLANKHMSPFEHCAKAVGPGTTFLRSNFDVGYLEGSGWFQYRKTIDGEFQGDANLEAIMATKPNWITLE